MIEHFTYFLKEDIKIESAVEKIPLVREIFVIIIVASSEVSRLTKFRNKTCCSFYKSWIDDVTMKLNNFFWIGSIKTETFILILL